MIELTKRGYRSGEPDGMQRESSQLMHMILSELRQERIGLNRLAAELQMSASDVPCLSG